MVFRFFFSSRRRHTRYWRDWSSDVCSSDLHTLPDSSSVPALPEWRHFHTPGHAPGHISLYREADGVLIAGDAFVTTKQESAISVMVQAKKLSGPPKYFTCDWQSAAWSVEQLAALEPEVVATGHGRPMRGEGMRKSL